MMACAVLMLAGCVARPTGDFGRAAPSWTHDTAMPAAGAWRASAAGEPVSKFNLTDQEKEMHNRVWRFLVSQHAYDWFRDTVTELQRTRLATAQDGKFSPARYYDWLRSTRYQSSRVRYATVEQDIRTDIATLPDTFAAICAVVEVDRQRLVSERGLHAGDPVVAGDVGARLAENDQFISWFIRALRYRYDAYGYALDQLLVETPHEEGRGVDIALREMAPYVARAESRDFCLDGGGFHSQKQAPLAGRVLINRDREVIDQK